MFLLRSIINMILSVIEIILILRIIMRLLGANALAPFVSWLYGLSEPLIRPFTGIFPEPSVQSAYVLDTTAIFALVVYMILGFVVNGVLTILGSAFYRHNRY